jgi:hypothetical protein
VAGLRDALEPAALDPEAQAWKAEVGVIVPLAEQVACVQRELKLRQRAYPRLVAGERMSQASAEREIRTMEAVLETVRLLEERERLL